LSKAIPIVSIEPHDRISDGAVKVTVRITLHKERIALLKELAEVQDIEFEL